MGVPCQGCGREYDVTLFEFGRTIHCTCGRRVALAARVRVRGAGAPARFLADAMLGRLAHWLRLLGFDTEWEADVSDAALVRRAIEEERALLTRDRALPDEWRITDVLVLRSETTSEQLGEVLRRFDLAGEIELFTRCSRCNALLEEVASEDVRGRVPERIRETHESFRRCPGCDRVYWSGSHTDRMRRVVAKLVGDL